jgi:hypothetical protein
VVVGYRRFGKSGSKSTTGTTDFTIRINKPWQSTALTGVTTYSLTILFLSKKPGLMERITGKPTKIELRPDNMNREKGSSEQVLEATHSNPK